MSLFNIKYISAEESINESAPLSLHATSAIVMDVKSGTVLYEKNSESKQYPASITKILTLLLSLENLDNEAIIESTNEDIDSVSRSSSHIAIDYGEQLNVLDLEYAMMLASANDAANVLASGISGTLSNFAELMNERAKEIGCTNSNFVNANGLHDDNHYTTAKDMALIMRELLNHEQAREILSTISYTMNPTNKQSEQRVFSTSFNMIKNTSVYDSRVLGGKNGYTPEAGYTSVAFAKFNDLEVIMVVLNEPDADSRYSDFTKMMEYTFSQYKTVVLSSDSIGIKDITLADNDETKVQFYLDSDINILLPFSTDETQITTEYEVLGTSSFENASAAINVYLSGQLIGSANAKVRKVVGNSEIVDKTEQNEGSDTIVDRLLSLSVVDYLSLGTLGLVIILGLVKKFGKYLSLPS